MSLSITLSSTPVKEFFSMLAKELGSQLEVNKGSYTIPLSEEIGEGEIVGNLFSSGLWITSYRCTFREDVNMNYSLSDVQPLEFLYSAKGELSYQFTDDSEHKQINQNQNMILAASKEEGSRVYFSKGMEYDVVILGINREKFRDVIEEHIDGLDQELQEVFSDTGSTTKFYHAGFYNLRIADIMQEIEDFQHFGFERRLFLESKAYEMLSQQIIQYNKDIQSDIQPFSFSKQDLESVREASQIIDEQLNDLDTIHEIANRVGTNPNKLQNAFKVFHGVTVNNYIRNIRLKKGRELLLSSSLSISEIAENVGITSNSYFSKIFKERYGVSPKRLRMMALEAKEDQKIAS